MSELGIPGTRNKDIFFLNMAWVVVYLDFFGLNFWGEYICKSVRGYSSFLLGDFLVQDYESITENCAFIGIYLVC